MFSDKQLKNLRVALLELHKDCHRLSVEELDDLLCAVDDALYASQYHSFMDFLGAVYDDYNSRPATLCESFYDYDWTIQFGDKSMTIHNDADIFARLLDVFTYHLQNI